MYFKQKSNVIYRNYGTFGYITDNRNFGYKLANDNKDNIGDKVVSESGAVFLSALSRDPQPINIIVKKICEQFSRGDFETIKNDAIEFYCALEADGFVVSGSTVQECNEKDIGFSYKNLKVGNLQKDSVLRNTSENSTQDFFDTYFNGEPQLTNLHIEIIGKCNERCIHCYIPHEMKIRSMESNMFYSILEQSRKMNLLHITISGGEPMIHNDFVAFLRKCNEYNFSVNVLSNLTLLNQNIIAEMRKNPLLCVQASLYSMDASVHDAITQQKNRYKKTKSAIMELIENDIPVQISCPIMKQNINSYRDVIEWGKKNNMNVSSDYVIIAGYDHTTQNLNCRLQINEICQIINQKINDNPIYLESIGREYEKKKFLNQDDYICSVCHSSICISETGNIYPCAGWQDYVIANINEINLSDVWENSPQIKYLRNLRRKDFPKCISCSAKEFCTMCMVRNANEDPQGDPLKVNEYFCEIAKMKRDIYFFNQKK